MLFITFQLENSQSLKKLSNSELQKPLKASKFWIISEMLMSTKFFVKFQCFHKKTTKRMFFFPRTLIDTKYKWKNKEKVELENSM